MRLADAVGAATVGGLAACIVAGYATGHPLAGNAAAVGWVLGLGVGLGLVLREMRRAP